MKLSFSEAAWDDYIYWEQTDATILSRLNDLIRDVRRSPFSGIGKPEPLRGNLQGWWSRRLTSEHRFVYRVSGTKDQQALDILTCRFHYHP